MEKEKRKKSWKGKLLSIFGDMKIQSWPPFLYYEPGDYYQISGKDTREILNLLQPGDLLLRGYRNYLDGLFIPGEYDHTGIYIGEGKVCHAVADGVQEVEVIDFVRCDRLAVLRPSKGQALALERLHSWLGKPYDFDFAEGEEAFYCHELAAEAYKELKIKKVTPYLGFFRFFSMDKRYLAESFLENAWMEKVWEKKNC